MRSVVNELTVGAAQLASPQRSNDTFITGKVKASLVDAKDLFANSFKVVTERGTVYLMGRVTEREADRAHRGRARRQRRAEVVRVFEVISEAGAGAAPSRKTLAQPDAAPPARAVVAAVSGSAAGA